MKKILIVDDDKDLLYSLSSYLSKKDYSIFAIETGTDAIGAASVFIPDLILLDINLGDMDGKEVCHRLKSDTRTTRIPVMMMSAEIDERAIKKICCPDDLIETPFVLSSLLSKIKALSG